MTKLVKEEQGIDVTCRIVGKTLWVYIPLDDLVEESQMAWNIKGLEKMNKVVGTVNRVVLSSDANLDFISVIGADVKKYGVEMKTIEYVPDFKEAVLERFSRGEFFARNARDVSVNPAIIGDMIGASEKFYDVTFDHFLGLQIIHRVKNLFVRETTLSGLFELKSTAASEKFGIIKLDFEFIRKKYEADAREESVKPLDYVKMIAAQVIQNYRYKDFQAVELTDTFSETTVKLTPEGLKKVKINLPQLPDE